MFLNVVEKNMIPYSEDFFGEPQGEELEVWSPYACLGSLDLSLEMLVHCNNSYYFTLN